MLRYLLLPLTVLFLTSAKNLPRISDLPKPGESVGRSDKANKNMVPVDPKAKKWVDSVYKSLTKDQRIAQLIVVRAHSNLGADHVSKVANLISTYNVGALCFFQGGPVRQAQLTNYYQGLAKTPLMITIDGEYGLGMRLDSVMKFPYQMTLGALSDTSLVYQMGLAVGEQHKRLGVHVNYAPVVDVNNNPDNPVIGYRSFGEDKERVARLGLAYMRGMQDAGIMACAKHFPGHGDVNVDSHLDLPVINKTRKQLDDLELYPFRELIKGGVQSIMIGHLFVPAIDNSPNRATSISKKAVTGLLRKDLGYQGLVFTDALEMEGVKKFFPGGTISVEALVAGNDMLCLPESVPETLAAVKTAIGKRKLSWRDIEEKVKRVLMAKYRLGLNHLSPVDTTNLLNDLNSKTANIRAKVAEKALTVVAKSAPDSFEGQFFSWPLIKGQKIACVSFGKGLPDIFADRLKKELGADLFQINYADSPEQDEKTAKIIEDGQYDAVVMGFHDIGLRNRNDNFGISPQALQHWARLNKTNSLTLVFGIPLALRSFCSATSLAVAYEDDEIFQHAAADWLVGKFQASGTLPVSVCNWKSGTGLTLQAGTTQVGDSRFAVVDSIALEGIAKKAYPGCVILAAQHGKIVYHKAFGHYEYESSQPVLLNSIYDLASVTKTSATTVAIMKLYEEGRLDIKGQLKDYLSWAKKTNKANLTLEELLLHQGGMVPFIPFYKETLDSAGNPRKDLYRSVPENNFTTQVARGLYLRNDWVDTIWKRILDSPVTEPNVKYIYSDNDFWFLGKIVENVTQKPLDKYVREAFYIPMNMQTTGYHPLERFRREQIVPTEREHGFRNQLIQGTVHDEGAALAGGVAGHAGLFSDAYDLGKLYQMLLNGGELNGKRFLRPETIRNFTSYHSSFSRRGYGFDKPERDNTDSNDPYPSSLASGSTFGHTGFTGTCVWVDPKNGILYIFLSNRVNPTRDNPRLGTLRIRGRIQDAIYRALGVPG